MTAPLILLTQRIDFAQKVPPGSWAACLRQRRAPCVTQEGWLRHCSVLEPEHHQARVQKPEPVFLHHSPLNSKHHLTCLIPGPAFYPATGLFSGSKTMATWAMKAALPESFTIGMIDYREIPPRAPSRE